MKQRYDCLICGELKTVSCLALRLHLKSQHNLELEEYYYRYLLKLQGPPLCRLPACSNQVKFKTLANGYRDYCSNNCKRIDRYNDKAFLELHRQRFKIQVAKWRADPAMKARMYIGSSERMARLRKNPAAAKNNAIASAETLRKLNKEISAFKRSHEGRTPSEDMLYNKLVSLGIYSISPDNRFFRGCRGGFIMDLTIPNLKINIELDGWRHEQSPDKDEKRDLHIQSIGWTIMRFKNEEVLSNLEAVTTKIVGEIERKKATLIS